MFILNACWSSTAVRAGFAAWLLLLAPLGANAEPVRIEQQKEGLLFTEAGQNILFYQRTNKSFEGKFTRRNYVHPLYSLDGNVLSEDFPADHRHHRGIFWAWHQVWVGDQKLGDPWAIRDFSWEAASVATTKHDDGSASLKAKIIWTGQLPDTSSSPGETPHAAPPASLNVVRERTTIRVYPLVRKDGAPAHRLIDFSIQLNALVDGVRIGGSEDRKGYGGFSARVRLPDDVRFTSSEGEVAPRVEAVQAGPWLDISATFDAPGQQSGLAILCHRSLPGYPQPWILRRRGSMQNAAYPGRHAAALLKSEPWELRYRLVVHRGDAQRVGIAGLYETYSPPPR